MLKPLVYVAGPYTNPDPVENTRNAIKVGMAIQDSGFAVIIPHLSMLSHFLIPRELDFWYNFDIDLLAHCHTVFRMEGKSTGADNEVEWAKAHSVPVFDSRSSQGPSGIVAMLNWKEQVWSKLYD